MINLKSSKNIQKIWETNNNNNNLSIIGREGREATQVKVMGNTFNEIIEKLNLNNREKKSRSQMTREGRVQRQAMANKVCSCHETP